MGLQSLLPMRAIERLQALVSEFSSDYLIVSDGEDGVVVLLSDADFARRCLPHLEDAISKAEHHAAQEEKREKQQRESATEQDGQNKQDGRDNDNGS